MPIGIMSALHEEISALVHELEDSQVTHMGQREYHQGRLWGQDVVLVFSRWGKVASAATAMNLIAKFQVNEILFTGVAGAIQPHLAVGDIVVAQKLWQHDMDARPIFEQYEIPLLGKVHIDIAEGHISRMQAAAETFLEDHFQQVIASSDIQEFGLQQPKVVVGGAATGDKFFSQKSDAEDLARRLPEVQCVEMEGAAVGQVCSEHEIPFGLVRVISDAADEGAALDFPKFIKDVAARYSYGIIKNYLQAL